MHKTNPSSEPERCLYAMVLKVSAGYVCPVHDHRCVELVYTYAGSTGMLFDGELKWPYGVGTVFGYQPGTRHWVENKSAGLHLCIGVDGGLAGRLPRGPIPANQAAIGRLMEIKSVAGKGSEDQLRRLNLLTGLLVLDLLAVRPEVEQSPAPSKAHRVRTLIDERFQQPVVIEDLADSLYVSPEHLRRTFREAFGVSPMHYLIVRRIDHASELLRTTDTPINEVARLSGIENPYYFSRLYRKVTGKTPTQERNSARQLSKKQEG